MNIRPAEWIIGEPLSQQTIQRNQERRLTAPVHEPCPCDDCQTRGYCVKEVACQAFYLYVKHGPSKRVARNWGGDKPNSYKYQLSVAQS